MISERVDGVVIGLLIGFDGDAPLVVFAGNAKDYATPARSLARLQSNEIGRQVALLYKDGDRTRPLIIGKIVKPAEDEGSSVVAHDGELTAIRAKKRIELRCGKAAIIMDSDGHSSFAAPMCSAMRLRQTRCAEARSA